MTRPDVWDPTQYGKFTAERARPVEDLLALVNPVPSGRGVGQVVDLGCGTGEWTARLHAQLHAAETVGVNSSAAMLAKARALQRPGLRFELGDIAAFAAHGEFDLVFSNAALHWVSDHPRLLGRVRDALRPAGQLAVQVPANTDHPSHALAFEIAHEAPFGDALRDAGDALFEATPVLAAERYAGLLDELGFTEQHVGLQVYGHHLASTAHVVEWTKATTLTRYQRGLTPQLYCQFVDRYRQRLLDTLGERVPYFYTFKRVLLWGQLPAPVAKAGWGQKDSWSS